MNLVLTTVALKVKNKGDATRKGSDYVTFICPNPKCGHRNKQSMYETQNYVPSQESWLPFKCTMCRTIVEVTPPASAGSLIVSPDDFGREMAQRRKDLNLNRH
jgi:hypothetical protein